MALNKKNMAKSTESGISGKLNQLVEGTEVKGDIVSDSNFRVDGKLIGSMNIKGKLVLGSTGYIEGNVSCKDAEVEGIFKGEIKVESFLSLKSTAKIIGEIETQRIAVEPGAEFTGNCTMANTSPVQ